MYDDVYHYRLLNKFWLFPDWKVTSIGKTLLWWITWPMVVKYAGLYAILLKKKRKKKILISTKWNNIFNLNLTSIHISHHKIIINLCKFIQLLFLRLHLDFCSNLHNITFNNVFSHHLNYMYTYIHIKKNFITPSSAPYIIYPLNFSLILTH